MATDGRAEQYTDSDLVVYHAFAASEWAVGIELQDNGDPSTPLTPAQIATTAGLLHELVVPRVLLVSQNPGDGIGYHEQFDSWNRSHHRCLGDVRRAQVQAELIPALRRLYEEDDMGLSEDDWKRLDAKFAPLLTKADGGTIRGDIGYSRDQVMTGLSRSPRG